jgi:hypothetical protein
MEGVDKVVANAWRVTVRRELALSGINTLDPARRQRYHDQPPSLNLSRKIVSLDLHDISSCRLVLANLSELGGGRAWGTVMEVALAAYHFRKPVIVLAEKDFKHPFIETFATELVYDLNEAIASCKGYFQ